MTHKKVSYNLANQEEEEEKTAHEFACRRRHAAHFSHRHIFYEIHKLNIITFFCSVASMNSMENRNTIEKK